MLRMIQPVFDPRLSYMNSSEFVAAAPGLTNVVPSRIVFPATSCPFLRPEFHGDATTRAVRLEQDCFHFDMSSLINRPGSWQAVQVTDPPCTTATFYVRYRFQGDLTKFYSQSSTAVSSTGGITLGDLYTALINESLKLYFVKDGSKATDSHVGTRSTSINSLFSELLGSAGEHALKLSYLRIGMMTRKINIPTDLEREQVRQMSQASQGALDPVHRD